MNTNMKVKVMTLVLAISIIFTGSISYGTSMTSNPQIRQRGLTFNTRTASDQIRLLKDFFRARGDNNVPWGYTYDNRTKELVSNYQRQVGLNSDGIAGKSTIDMINKEIKDKGLEIGLRVPYTDTKGEMVIINKSSNTLYHLKDGLIQSSYPVATGKTEDLTPNGKFTIVVKYKNPAWGGAGVSKPIPGGVPQNPLGTRWIGISYGGGGRYGVHGNANPGSIGTYASLGCVRMFNGDVEQLYDNIKTNTPIWIGSESLLESYGVKFKSNYKGKPVIKEEVIPQKEINIILNGEKIKLKDSVINKDGTTYYPFREILEKINAQVIWDEENQKVTGILEDNYVEFKVNSNEYINNYEIKYLPVGQKAFININKTYVPIRNLMEGLGYNVDWDQSTSTVIITSKVIEDVIPEDETLEEEVLEEDEVKEEEVLEDEVKEEILDEDEVKEEIEEKKEDLDRNEI